MKSSIYKMALVHWFAALAFCVLTMFMVACSSSDSNDSTEITDGGSSEDAGIYAVKDWEVAGVSQKGPFVTGSVVIVHELDSLTLNQTGKSFRGEIKSDKGNFDIKGINLASQYALLEATGYYRNEISGENSSGTVTLTALTDLSDRNKVNINLLTHLEYERVMHLVLEKGESVAEAKAKAEREILSVFGIDGDIENSEDLNIFESGDANAALLAISILMQGNQSVAGLTERMGNFRIALASKGKWDDAKTKTEMADWANEADFGGTLRKISENINGWGFGSVPDFAKYVRNFWYENYGIGTCSESREGEIAADSNKLSINYYEDMSVRYICLSGRWELLSDTAGFGVGAEGEIRAGLVTDESYIYENGKWELYDTTAYVFPDNVVPCFRNCLWGGTEGEIRHAGQGQFVVYDGGSWRNIKEIEWKYGACTSAMPEKIVDGYLCKDGEWTLTDITVADVDVQGLECVEGGTVVGVNTGMEYTCTEGKFVADLSRWTWFGTRDSDEVYFPFSTEPFEWYIDVDEDFALSLPSEMDVDDESWVKKTIESCKGVCAQVTCASESGVCDPGYVYSVSLGSPRSRPYDFSELGGLCIAYSSTQTISVYVDSDNSVKTVLPASDTVRVERIPWSSFVLSEYVLREDLSEFDSETGVKSVRGLSFEMPLIDSLRFNIVSVGGYNGDCDKYAKAE